MIYLIYSLIINFGSVIQTLYKRESWIETVFNRQFRKDVNVMDAVVQTKSVENSASLGSIFRLSESGDLIRLDHDQVSECEIFNCTSKKNS